jgi:hydrogenase/urease accessory protein HupE
MMAGWRMAVARWCVRLALAGCTVLLGPAAQAHEMSLAEMTLREVGAGQFLWAWGAPGKNKPIAEDLTPIWPEGCTVDAQTVRCGPAGMTGTLQMQGVGKAYSAAIVRITWRNGERQVVTLTSAQPRVQLFGGAADGRGGGEIAVAYGLLGVEHILTGLDHLLFVISLLLLVGFERRLVATITAFTLAHSLTLAASAMGLLVLRAPPVEATIALSIVLVSAEALRSRDTLTRRWPALVAFVFGLVHGLGFAGALKEIGLPEQHASIALLTFNLGVEAGQLAVVGLAWVASRVLLRYTPVLPARKALLYAVGSVASYWTLGRIAAILA